MSEKANKISDILKSIRPDWSPAKPPEDVSLLEVGLLCILSRRLTASQSLNSLRALQKIDADWNELRVSQIQEFEDAIKSKNHDLRKAVARDVKAFLQEIFQKNHGFDIEFLRQDVVEAGKFLQELDFLGESAAHFVLHRAHPEAVPVTTSVIRVLDRLGAMKRTSSVRKASATLESIVPEEKRDEFAVRIGLVAERWCDSKKPICWECALVHRCPYGKKVQRDWKAQQIRLEAQRKKEEERRRKEEERDRKRAEVEAKKRARELERKRAKDERVRSRERARREREEAKRKREAERLAKKKTAEKKAAEKKVTAKKAAAKKKKATKSRAKAPARSSRTGSKKKVAKKKTSAKKTGAKKKTSAKKKTTKKKAAKKVSGKRRPSAKKKSSSRSRR